MSVALVVLGAVAGTLKVTVDHVVPASVVPTITDDVGSTAGPIVRYHVDVERCDADTRQVQVADRSGDSAGVPSDVVVERVAADFREAASLR